MQKITIMTDKKDSKLFLDFWKNIEDEISHYKNVSIKNINDKIETSFELPKKNTDKAIYNLKKNLAESIVLYYKTKYISENATINIEDMIKKQALFHTLAIFDKQSDIDYTLNQLVLSENSENFVVESFYMFRLSELRRRWQEICDLVSNNFSGFFVSEACTELLRYLVNSIDVSNEKVFIYRDKQKVVLKDTNGKVLCNSIELNDQSSNAVVVSQLIKLAPGEIQFLYTPDQDDILDKYIIDIFTNKVVFNA